MSKQFSKFLVEVTCKQSFNTDGMHPDQCPLIHKPIEIQQIVKACFADSHNLEHGFEVWEVGDVYISGT